MPSDPPSLLASELPSLRAGDLALRDLARDRAEIVEARSDSPTGLRLVSLLGSGGMSTVFLAQADHGVRSGHLSPLTPRRVAVKFLQAAAFDHFRRMNQDPSNVFLREVVALGRMMERQPPSEFVVGFYGSGYADVDCAGLVRRLPWLAVEFVDGGTDGASLTDRVERSAHGVDPIRALRLLRGVFAGAVALHGEGIIHRDLKPDNVLVAGPVDDETPKLADCGIARVDGLVATIAAMTPAYGGPEQMLSLESESNPLVGPWTDVHALAAVAWFILGGCDWCLGDSDTKWNAGERRSLRTAERVHPGFMAEPALLAEIDAVLARGAAPRLPDVAWAHPEAARYRPGLAALLPAAMTGAARFASVEAFRDQLLPLLERAAVAWAARAGRENRAATAFRPTQLLRAATSGAPRSLAREIAPCEGVAPTAPGSVVFQPDGRVLARFGDRLYYFIDDEPHGVSVPANVRPLLGASSWLTRGPGGGFAAIGAEHVLLVLGGAFSRMPLPARADGGEIGPIQAVVDDGRTFGVITAETDDSNGGPELWTSGDGTRWAAPVVLPLGGDVRRVAFGPYGFLVVGARGGKRARAIFVGFDYQPIALVVGVNDRPPLLACVCSAGREAWGAGTGFVLSFDRTTVREEIVDTQETPVAMGLDVVGVPWLVTTRTVARRHVESGAGRWRVYHQRTATEAPFVGIGFTPDGARVLDELGGGVHITPDDVETWRARSSAPQSTS